jgi:hypothetical protein
LPYQNLVCRFSNDLGQSITTSPASAFITTVFTGSPSEVFTAMAPSSHAIESFNTLISGDLVRLNIDQINPNGLLLGIVIEEDGTIKRQFSSGSVSLSSFVINFPVTTP